MKPVAIIKTGGTFPELAQEFGDFEDWTRQGMGLTDAEVVVIPMQEGGELPGTTELSAAVITGSHAMVTDNEAWMRDAAAWLRHAVAVELPVLGICFGHQLLAEALGGKAGWNPCGREIGTVDITLNAAGRTDPLLGQLPGIFPAQVTHRQSALELPPAARLLASSPGDPHQAFRIGSAWGVQFHPEFPKRASEYYIRALAGDLLAEGFQPEQLCAALGETPEASTLLRRFAQLVGETRSE